MERLNFRRNGQVGLKTNSHGVHYVSAASWDISVQVLRFTCSQSIQLFNRLAMNLTLTKVILEMRRAH